MAATDSNVMEQLKRAMQPANAASPDGPWQALLSLATLLAGEDTAVGVTRVEERFGYTNLPSSTNGSSYIIKSGAGFLHSLVCNMAGSTDTVVVYDNPGGSGVIIGTIFKSTQGATQMYDATFSNGLTLKMTGSGGGDWTVNWR